MSTGTPIPRIRRLRSLVGAVAFLIVIGLVTTGWIVLKELQVQRNVYTRILEHNMETTRSQFRLFLNPLSDHLATLAQWRTSDLLDPARPAELAALVTPLLDRTPQVAGLYIYPAEGPPVQLLRDGEGWRVTSLAVNGDSPLAEWLAATRAANDDAAWSGYLPLPGDGRPGLLRSRVVDGDVLALGLPEDDLDRFTATAAITERGILLRRFAGGTVAWLTPQEGNRLDITASGDLLTSGRPEHAVIGRALMEWGRQGRPYAEPMRFRESGETWWCTFYPAVDGTDPGELGLIAPADDLASRLETVTGRVTVLLAVLLALAMTVVAASALAYRRRWQRVVRRRPQAPGTEQELADLVAGGESDILEFKSTMRWNLHADRAGKEMEIAWLKTVVGYLNTGGGFLVIGVADDGGVLGIEADQFPNEDKFLLHFDNLIKQHVGLEFAGAIRGAIRDLGGRRVFLVSCDRCDQPVYLRDGEKEEFYIRVNASTRKLPISRIAGYLEERDADL